MNKGPCYLYESYRIQSASRVIVDLVLHGSSCQAATYLAAGLQDYDVRVNLQDYSTMYEVPSYLSPAAHIQRGEVPT